MSIASPSFWLDPAPTSGPSLEQDIAVDVAIVGAGYTGLCAALALRRLGADVAVIERDYAGFGASGRNAGHLTPTIGKDVPTLLKLYGRERGRGLVALAEHAVEHTEARIADDAIDCDYVAAGNVLAGVNSRQAATLERAAAAASEAGAPVRMLPPGELRERRLPAAFTCGYIEERGGVLNPGKYIRALREQAVAAGAQLYENTPVQKIGGGTPVTIETPRGNVRAATCVLATNAFTPKLGLLRLTAVPIRVSMFATEPLAAEQRERIGWPNGEGVYTAHESLESYRLSADGRLVGGSRYVTYAYGSGIGDDDQTRSFKRLEAMFRRRFPELTDVAIDRFWSGPIAFALDFLPAIGRTGRDDNIIHSIAYAGHGVAMASFAGALAGRMAAGHEPGGEWQPLLKRRRPPLPPEPLRWLAVKGIIGGLELIDRRTDRRAARERAK